VIGQVGRQPLQRVVHEPPLHLRRNRAGALVHRDDATGMNRLAVFLVQDLVLRVGELQAGRAAHLHGAVQDHVLASCKDVLQKRLIQPCGTQRSAAVVDRHLENLEAGAARRTQAARDDPSGDRRPLAGLQRRDRLEAAPVFVAKGKAIEQIFDREEAGVLEVGSAPRSNTLEELQRRRQHGIGCPVAAWIRHGV
jgi:hypothetical protein